MEIFGTEIGRCNWVHQRDSKNEKTIKFIVEIGEGKYDEILSYNEIFNCIEE